MRDQRLRYALVEIGIATSPAFAGIEKNKAQTTAAKNLTHGAFAEWVFTSVIVDEDQGTLATLFVVNAVSDEMNNLILTGREPPMNHRWGRACQRIDLNKFRFNKRFKATLNHS